MSTTIRQATCEDAAAIARVHVASWLTTYRGLMPDAVLDGLSVERRQRQWEQWLCGVETAPCIFVAEDEHGEVIGFASGGPPQVSDEVPGYDSELYTVYLLQTAQRQGAGRRLVAAVAEHLLAAGNHAMLLWVLGTNEPSRRFYERIGGRELMTKPANFGGAMLDEVAYGYDLPALVGRLGDEGPHPQPLSRTGGRGGHSSVVEPQ